MRRLPAILLSLLIFGCAGIPKRMQLPVPPCPQEQVDLRWGWLETELRVESRELRVKGWGMTKEDRETYERWVQDWKTCARARGAAIGEANK